MALALVLSLALGLAQTEAPAAATPDPAPASAPADAGVKTATRQDVEDVIPDGAPTDDYRFVAWCHGALAGQMELDPVVEKDMDAIEGKAAAAKRKADDDAIAKQHKIYMALYEKALLAAERASPTAIHQDGVEAELQGYRIWGPTKNKAPVWRMVDWGNWEVPPHCQKAAQRLYDRSTLLGAALKPEEVKSETAKPDEGAPAAGKDAGPAASTDAPAPDAPQPSPPKPDDLRGPH
jgi:hypothetical protein